MSRTIDLYEAHVPTTAVLKEPYSVEEIDNHPNADRIWATIKAVREFAESVGYDEGYSGGWDEAEHKYE